MNSDVSSTASRALTGNDRSQQKPAARPHCCFSCGGSCTRPALAAPRAPPQAFNKGAFERRVRTALLLQSLPHAPLVRRPTASLHPSHARVVRARRAALLQREAMQRGAILARREDAGDDILASRAAAREEEVRAMQRQWLVVLSVMQFARLMTSSSETAAISVLRTLFAPVVRRVREGMRRRKRQAMIMKHLGPQMPPVTAEALQHNHAFSWWSPEMLQETVRCFEPRGIGAGGVVAAENSVGFGVCVLVEGTVEVTKRTPPVLRSLHPHRPHEEVIGIISASGQQQQQQHILPVFGELSVLSPSMPLVVGYRAASSRVLFWHLSATLYNSFLDRQCGSRADEGGDSSSSRSSNIPAADLARMLSKRAAECRQRLVPLLFRPTPQMLHNSRRNRLFADWSERQLQALAADALAPRSLARGEVLFDIDSPIEACFFVANGVIELRAAREVAASFGDNNDNDNDEDERGRGHRHASTRPEIVGPWTCIGDRGVLTHDRHLATAVAKTDVDGWLCAKADLLRTLSSDPGLHLKVKARIASIKAEELGKASRAPLRRYLVDHPLLSLCKKEQIAALAAHAAPRWFPAHEVIASSSMESMMIIIVGGIARTRIVNSLRELSEKERLFPQTLSRGAVLGAAAALSGSSWLYPFVVEAQTPVEAFCLDARTLRGLLSSEGAHGLPSAPPESRGAGASHHARVLPHAAATAATMDIGASPRRASVSPERMEAKHFQALRRQEEQAQLLSRRLFAEANACTKEVDAAVHLYHGDLSNASS